MAIDIHRRALGVFTHRRDAERVLHQLRDSGFPMDRVSVVVRDADRNQIAGASVHNKVGNKADEGATVGALSGGALGGLTGLLVGLGTLAIPGVGPIMLAGATATTLATTLAGAGIGAATGGLIGGLLGLGIPEDRARVYNARVERGHYLVIVDGTDADIARAEAILHRGGIEEYGIYDHPHTKHASATVVHPSPKFTKHTVGYFSLLHDAQAAIRDLQTAGLPLSQISLVCKDVSVRDKMGGVGVSDHLNGVTLGLPDVRDRFYNELINRGEYILTVSGTEAQVRHASSILHQHSIRELQIYDPLAIHPSTSTSTPPPVTHTPASFDTSQTQYSTKLNHHDPDIIIVDRRDEPV